MTIPTAAALQTFDAQLKEDERTAWHTHTLGQTLIVTSGMRLGAARGWTGRRDSSRRCRMVPARRKALARRDACHRHDAHRHSGKARRQSPVDWMEHVTGRAGPRTLRHGETAPRHAT